MDRFEDFSHRLPDVGFWCKQVLSGPHENFHYLIGDPHTKHAAVIDPAFHVDRLFAMAEDEGYHVTTALFTHGHWDHIAGIPEIFDHGVQEAIIHEAAAGHEKIALAGRRARLARDDETVPIGGLPVKVMHTPGHQPEGTCFRAGRALFGGDTLFVGTCGRTDFTGGDTDAMYRSMARLRGLPDDTIVLPGHHYHEAPWRTLAQERVENPALATRDREAFGRLHCLTH